MGGQILKSDPRSQSEMIERTALRNEETGKLGRTETTDSTAIGKADKKARKMSLG